MIYDEILKTLALEDVPEEDGTEETETPAEDEKEEEGVAEDEEV